jgi:metal-sulfur cluster biosynthetic enzyme
MGESISDGTKSCLENTFEGYNVTVNLTFDPPWSAEKISPEGQEFLN